MTRDESWRADPPTAPDHLFTWVDLDRYFAELAGIDRWPNWLYEVSAFWDRVQITLAQDILEQELWEFLSSVLGPLTVDPDRRIILLESALTDAAEPDRFLDVEIDRAQTPVTRDDRPRWGARRIVSDWFSPLLPPRHEHLPHGVSIGVFHSFKGGVGRTLHCVATAHAIAASGWRVLLIDADLEAPGITWMAQSQSLRTDFAFEDFLALVHGSDSQPAGEGIRLGRKFLANQEIDRVVLMPSRRDYSHLEPARIEPLDLLTPDRDPYLLSETLAELAHSIGVQVVLVYLRAGVSDLNSPFLFDPRLHRVVVSTISDQSVRGTLNVVREITRRAPARPDTDDPDLSVLLTQFSLPDHENLLQDIAVTLRDALTPRPRAESASTVDADVDVPLMLSRFDPRFLNLPPAWSEVRELIDSARLAQTVQPLVDALSPIFVTAVPTVVDVVDHGPRRRLLHEAAQSLIFAETSGSTGFLATEALVNLAESHRTEVPIEVVIGGKGSGKTFTFLQVCERQYWADFVAAVTGTQAATQARTVPVLGPANLSDDVEFLQERRAEAAYAYGHGVAADRFEILDLIRAGLRTHADDTTWRRIWLACLAVSVGLVANPATAESVLADLARRGKVLFVLDGLEEIFDDFTADRDQQRALRVLLTDCPEWLRSLRQRLLGLLTFVRQDLAQAAITQNFAQFQARHSNFALRWNQDEALRLAAWVCLQGGVLDADEDEIRESSAERLSQLMLSVWGEKMGSPKSKEARSEQWFYAALADFSGQIQARDIVAFISASAEFSEKDRNWPQRVLTPAAMRNALPVCSRQKIEAITQENPPVGMLLTALRELADDQRKVPFDLQSVAISLPEAKLLETNGVVFRESDVYWIPEIFRHGLGFRATGRPRVLAIANLVRRQNDLGR